VPDMPRTSLIDTLEVIDRAEHARRIVTGFSRATPNLTHLWVQVDDALRDIPALTTEITRLRDLLTASRMERANLAAAGRATIAAYGNGERDPFSYLRDELLAQGFGTGRGDA
jgi:hypothetical protein